VALTASAVANARVPLNAVRTASAPTPTVNVVLTASVAANVKQLMNAVKTVSAPMLTVNAVPTVNVEVPARELLNAARTAVLVKNHAALKRKRVFYGMEMVIKGLS